MKFIRAAVGNPVAVNILMFAVIAFGIFEISTIVREFFPPVQFDRIVISTPFPGATPEEVEKGMITKIESAIEEVDGVDEITSQAFENYGLVIVKTESGDIERIADDLRTQVDTIQDLPEEVEESIVDVLEQEVPVISVVIFGDASERKLKRVAEEVKDELVASPLISRALISGIRQEEISVEVQPDKLEAYDLTLEEVGRAVQSNNVDIAGGEVKASTGKVLLRTLGEDQSGLPLEQIVIRSDEEGRAIRVGDVATVRDGFEETPLRGMFQGKRAVQVTIFKRLDEDAVRISNYVKDYLQEKPKEFAGQAINFEYRVDLARFIEQRIALLTKNAAQGLFLVFVTLALFLSLRLAFWVGVGLFVAFMGTFIIMDAFGTTINMISLFGLILVIGMLVDDAIVVAENIYAKIEENIPPHVAAIDGASEVFRPVLATVLTTVVAFLPLAFIEGVMGDFLAELPIVVTAALLLSLIESFCMLPSHLAEFSPPAEHIKSTSEKKESAVKRGFNKVADGFDWFQRRILDELFVSIYIRILKTALNWRYVTIFMGVFISMLTVALIVAGFLPFVLFQKVDADTLVSELEMTNGTPAAETERALEIIADAVLEMPEVKNVFSVVGFKEEAEVQNLADPAIIGEVIVELKDAEERNRSSDAILNEWREKVGAIAGANKLKFRDRSGGPPGPEIEIKVRGNYLPEVDRAVRHVKERMQTYPAIRDIEDDGGAGKMEFRIRMKDTARSLGLSEADIALQVRSAFFGYEAQILQRDREEVKVWVRLDEESRSEPVELLRMRVRTPSGNRVPLGEIAQIEQSRGVSSITRIDGLRTVTITSDVDYAKGNTNEITAALEKDFDNLSEEFPGVRLTFEGAKKETADSIGSLKVGFPVALILVYVILAILFKSYIQPVLVMIIIPYAIIGAALGHLIYGFIPGREMMPITFLSMIGMVGLSGIVVNDSLILVTFINEARRLHPGSLFDSIVKAGRRRFRPIVLTSITTVLGLFPMMLETSFQAQFLIPMAISISFGLALATVLTLLLLPCIYMILEDMRTALHWLITGRWEVVHLVPSDLVTREEIEKPT